MEIRLILPKPPSVNDMHGIGRGKYLKQKTIDWYQAAGEEIIQQLGKRETIEGKVQVHIVLRTTENDLDNVRKCLYDLLKLPTVREPYGMGLITDDRMIYQDSGRKEDVKHRSEECIIVRISKLE